MNIITLILIGVGTFLGILIPGYFVMKYFKGGGKKKYLIDYLKPLTERADALVIARDSVTGSAIIAPVYRYGGNVFGSFIYTPTGVKAILTVLDDRYRIGILEDVGIPVFVCDGRWITPNAHIGFATETALGNYVIAKLVDDVTGSLNVEVGSERVGKLEYETKLALLFARLVEMYMKHKGSLKVVEFTPYMYIGISTPPSTLIMTADSISRNIARDTVYSISEMFKRGSTIEEMIRKIPEYELQKKQIKLNYILMAIVAILIVAGVVNMFIGGTSGLVQQASKIFIGGTAPPHKATVVHHTAPKPSATPSKPPPTVKTGKMPMPTNVTRGVYAPTNKTAVPRLNISGVKK